MLEAQFTKEKCFIYSSKEKVLIYSHFWISNIETVVINLLNYYKYGKKMLGCYNTQTTFCLDDDWKLQVMKYIIKNVHWVFMLYFKEIKCLEWFVFVKFSEMG